MGVVYLADDTRLGRPVAIKALGSHLTADPSHRERLRREARAVAALSHPGIATVYALEEVDNSLYVVSEYVAGQTLRDEVVRGPLPLERLLTTSVEIMRALVVAHEHGVVHRDLKPENVIRTPDGAVKILDFGLARVERPNEDPVSRLTGLGMILGTPGYMPPEQLRGLDVDFRADIFAFGALLYELASGVHPFTRSNAASTIARVLEADPPDVVQLNPSCPVALGAIIRRCLQKNPALRFASTRELGDRLEELRRDAAEAEPRRSHTGTRDAPTGRWRTPSTQLGWWQFHQAVVGGVYCLMLIPLWLVRGWTPGALGSLVFFVGVGAVGVAATLRFHLWFVSCFNASELATQQAQAFPWIRAADWVFVLLLFVAGALVANTHPSTTALLMGVAVGNFVAFRLIEPATARAAFKR